MWRVGGWGHIRSRCWDGWAPLGSAHNSTSNESAITVYINWPLEGARLGQCGCYYCNYVSVSPIQPRETNLLRIYGLCSGLLTIIRVRISWLLDTVLPLPFYETGVRPCVLSGRRLSVEMFACVCSDRSKELHWINLIGHLFIYRKQLTES